MDVDTPMKPTSPRPAMGEKSDNNSSQQEKTLKVHPLVIIGISDHHTRVTRGGSQLSRDAPVLGLLFGYQDGLEVSIVDAEEVEYSFSSDPSKAVRFGGGTEAEHRQHRESIKTKIELHREVFPTHEVIGWYRVGKEVTAEDLHINNGPMKEYNESPLFVLMNPNPGGGGGDEGEATKDELPISMYETLVTMGGGTAGGGGDGAAGEGIGAGQGQQQQPRAVFVGLDFELDMGEPERIAVEKVFKAQATDGASGLDVQFQSLTSSIESMNARVSVLLDFLRKTQGGEIPPDHKLLRQVDGLLRQLPVLTGADLSKEFTEEYDDALVITYLAAMAKTAKAMQGYSEKFRIAYESSTSTAREMRRGY